MAGLITCVSASAIASDNRPLFASGIDYEVGEEPVGIALGDLDNDGDLDLVTTNLVTHSASVLLANGDGTFAALTNYTVGEFPWGVALADVDGDNDLDLLTANAGSNSASILLGNGDGTFASHVQFATGEGPFDIAIGDLNRDGMFDLVTADSSSDSASVLLGNGDGTFGARMPFAVGVTPRGIELGDLDGDGDLDLVVTNTGSSLSDCISVLLGNGDGTFALQSQYGVGNDPWSVALADLDGDGDLDVVTANLATHDASVLLGIGDGTFSSQSRMILGVAPTSIAAGDLDSDGDLDLVIANLSTDNASVLLGNGAGGFTPQMRFALGTDPWSIALGDLDGDGALDLATANRAGDSASVLLANGDGTFPAPAQYEVGTGTPSSALGDLDGDGDLDVLTANTGSDSASILLGIGDGTFAPQVEYAVGDFPISIASGYLNEDDAVDIVTANWFSDTVSVLLGNGDGTFSPQMQFLAGDGPIQVVLGHLDGDDALDIVTANEFSDSVSVLLGKGDGTFATQMQYAAGDWPNRVAIGDLDGDGDLDLVTGNSASGLSASPGVLLGNGDGSFAARIQVPVDVAPAGIVLGDLDRDGTLDLVMVDPASDTASILLGNGDGTFAALAQYAVGDQPRGIALGDLDGDGVLDVVAATQFGERDTACILLGAGDGTFGQPSQFNLGRSTRSIAVGDLDGDGLLDLITTNYNSSQFSGSFATILLGNSIAPAFWSESGGMFNDDVQWLGGATPSSTVRPHIAVFDSTATGQTPDAHIALGADASVWGFAHANGQRTFDLAGHDLTIEGDSVPVGADLALDLGVRQCGDGADLLPETLPVLRPENSGAQPSMLWTIGAIIGRNGPAMLELAGGAAETHLHVAGDFAIGRGGDGVVALTSDLAAITYGGAERAVVNIGAARAGLVDVQAGAVSSVERIDFLSLGLPANGEGTIRIDGPTSTWMHQSERMVVGGSGRGVIEVTGGGLFESDVSEGMILAQRGISEAHVRISGNGSMWVDIASVTVGGAGDATVIVEDGAVLSVNEFTIGATGILRGDSVVVGNPANGGYVAPGLGGAPFETLTINGDYSQFADLAPVGVRSGELQINVSDSESSLLDVTGTATLAGQLVVGVSEGEVFDPPVGAEFTVLTAAQIVDRFDVAFLPGLSGGKYLRVEYRGDVVTSGGGAAQMSAVYEGGDDSGVELTPSGSTRPSQSRRPGRPAPRHAELLSETEQQGRVRGGNAPGALAGAQASDSRASQTRGGGASVVLVVDSLNGDIDLEGGATFSASGPPNAAAVGDFGEDDDGDIDLAVTIRSDPPGQPGFVAVLYNDGTNMNGAWNGFSSEQTIQVNVGVDPNDLVIADIDNNGFADISVVNRGDDTVSVLRNDGAGGFMSAIQQDTFFVGDDPRGIAAADLDGMNGADLAVTGLTPPSPPDDPGGEGILSILLNSGGVGQNWDGFDVPMDFATLTDPTDVDPNDFDNDKDLDIAVALTDDGIVTVLINLGFDPPDGWLGFAAGIDIPVGRRPVDLTANNVDLDLDGYGDIVTANRLDGTLSIVLNLGDQGGDGIWDGGFGSSNELEVGARPTSVAAAPLDEDADLDLAVVVEDETGERFIRILRNDLTDGQLIFAEAQQVDPGAEPLFVLAADVDMDGANDLITINESTGSSNAQANSAVRGGAGGANDVSVVLNDLSDACRADVNGSGVVDFQDLIAVLGNFNTASPLGDANGDGAVDNADLTLVLGQFRAECPTAPGAN